MAQENSSEKYCTIELNATRQLSGNSEEQQHVAYICGLRREKYKEIDEEREEGVCEEE